MSDLQDRYNIARRAKTGTEIQCPVCLKPMMKTTYHKVFCSNQKTKPGRSSCKDRYWNTVSPRGEYAPNPAGNRDLWIADQHPFDLDDGIYDENGE